jgi:hypothetical protein
MISVLLLMNRRIMSDAIMQTLADDSRFKFYASQKYRNVGAAARTFTPNIALVEIPESKAYHPEEYIEICTEVRDAMPGCKLLLMCPEDSGESKKAAVEAMQTGKIDDFVYYDVSIDYLVSKLLVLSGVHSNHKKAEEKIS